MYPNLETERVRRGYAEFFLAEKLGISEEAYRIREKSGAFQLSEARALSELYKQPVEYLFRLPTES